jgi:enoyl-CoA hydratase/carnithine racemase
MALEKDLQNNSELKLYIEDDIAIISNDSNAFATLTQFEQVEKLLNFYDKIAQSSTIKAVLIINQIGGFSETAYEKFLNNIENKQQHKKDVIFAIEINMLRRFILKILNLDKLVFFAMEGNVITPFMGLSLAADFRFGSDDLIFNLNHKKYGIHPTGGLPFFLNKYLSPGKANELLYKGGFVSAKEALNLGLINEIFLANDLFENSINAIKKIISDNNIIFARTKRLNNCIYNEIESYFKTENSLIGI